MPLGKLVSTLLALRELALLEMNRTYGTTAAHALAPCAALGRPNIARSQVLKPLQDLAAATGKAEARPCEPSLRVTSDPETLSHFDSAASLPGHL